MLGKCLLHNLQVRIWIPSTHIKSGCSIVELWFQCWSWRDMGALGTGWLAHLDKLVSSRFREALSQNGRLRTGKEETNVDLCSPHVWTSTLTLTHTCTVHTHIALHCAHTHLHCVHNTCTVHTHTPALCTHTWWRKLWTKFSAAYIKLIFLAHQI